MVPFQGVWGKKNNEIMNKFIFLIGLLTFTLQNKAQTIADADGNTYNTITIGKQVWLKENLKTTKYNDNTSIPNITSLSAWASTYSAAYCWNNFDINTYKATYGALYNWYAINTDKLCPLGWHVPSYAEFDTLITYLGGTSVAGGKLKEAGLAHWRSPNEGADNSSGFTALPGGLIDPVNNPFNFHLYGGDGHWWSSSLNTSSEAWEISLAVYVSSTSFTSMDKRWGFSVRCMKDISTGINTGAIEYTGDLVYPNPANEKVYIKDYRFLNDIVVIYDLQGKKVIETMVGKEPIDISILSRGIYIVRIIDSKKNVFKKLIVLSK